MFRPEEPLSTNMRRTQNWIFNTEGGCFCGEQKTDLILRRFGRQNMRKQIMETKQENVIRADYSEIMQKSYIDYAMSVIISRALPDVRDG